jgi:hypothetical protein
MLIGNRIGYNSEIPFYGSQRFNEDDDGFGNEEVMCLERKVKILMISTVLIVAILSGIAVLVYANGVSNGTNTASDTMFNYGGCYKDTIPSFGRYGRGRGCGWTESITVSQAYKDNVINIAKNDSDVQKLFAEGYNITNIKPIITTTIEADGTVTMKATTAIVTLRQNTTGISRVWVNVEQAKVTRIVICTRTVIEKP